MCLCSPGSINWYQRKLGAKQALHATHWPHVRGLAASAGVWLRAIETEISTALWALVASWLGGSVVERRSLTGEFSLVCTGPAADG